MNFTYKNINYKVGDNIKFFVPKWKYANSFTKIEWKEEYVGTVIFSAYEDNEGYRNFKHLGFFVKYVDEHDIVCFETFPDAIDYFHGELVK